MTEQARPLEELLDELERTCSHPRLPFTPQVFHSVEGDMLEIYLSPEPSIAEWVPPGLVTIHKDPEDRSKVLGVTVHGIGKVMRQTEQDHKKLADAVATERERCATIAQLFCVRSDKKWVAQTAQEIATAIRDEKWFVAPPC
jgi:hypothetical protein